MLKKFLNLFKKKKKKEVDGLTFAKAVVDDVLTPSIIEQIETMNKFLKDKEIMIGADIKWLFQKIE